MAQNQVHSILSLISFFSCARDHKLVLDLARGAKGMLALGRNPVGLPTQLSSFFGGGLRRKFAICLPSKPKTNGVIFFGDSPYIFYPSYNQSKTMDVSSWFAYTKLYINPVSTAQEESNQPNILLG